MASSQLAHSPDQSQLGTRFATRNVPMPLLACAAMDTLFGLPAHPLLVHIPIVLLPLAAIGVIVMLVKPEWHRRYRWVVLGMGVAGALGAALAAQAGEELVSRVIAVEGREAARRWQHHADLGETSRNVALIFLVVLVAFVFLPWWQERSGRQEGQELAARSRNLRLLTIAVSALAVLTAVGTVVTIVEAGHTGSKSVWDAYVHDTGG